MSDPIRNKISALLRKAESTPFEEEASLFLAKAQELMEKHQIEVTSFDEDGRVSKGEGVKANSGKPFEPGTPASEKFDLEAEVARFFGCRVIRVLGREFRKKTYTFRDTQTLRIYGTESALTTHELMFPFIWKQVLRLAHNTSAGDPKLKRRLQRDISRALAERLRSMRWDREDRGARTPSGSTALVVQDAENRIDQLIQEEFGGNLTSLKPRKLQPTSGLSRVLANQVSLNLQTEKAPSHVAIR